ncbi:MAG TPA: PqqD family protein [Gaiellaceae bacterium]
MAARFRVNSPNVIHETIEGEVILIDLTSGTYYSLREAGAAIWQAIEWGADEDDALAALRVQYEGSEQEMRDGVRQLLDQLVDEGLIRSHAGPAPMPETPLPASNGGPRAPFRPPALEKHTDMQDLILLDPVHEVGAQGWPQPAPADEGRE